MPRFKGRELIDTRLRDKLQPFANARALANAGCGGVENRDPGVQRPTQTFRPGDTVEVQWSLTIPHPDDNLNTGVRVVQQWWGEADRRGDRCRRTRE